MKHKHESFPFFSFFLQCLYGILRLSRIRYTQKSKSKNANKRAFQSLISISHQLSSHYIQQYRVIISLPKCIQYQWTYHCTPIVASFKSSKTMANISNSNSRIKTAHSDPFDHLRLSLCFLHILSIWIDLNRTFNRLNSHIDIDSTWTNQL